MPPGISLCYLKGYFWGQQFPQLELFLISSLEKVHAVSQILVMIHGFCLKIKTT